MAESQPGYLPCIPCQSPSGAVSRLACLPFRLFRQSVAFHLPSCQLPVPPRPKAAQSRVAASPPGWLLRWNYFPPRPCCLGLPQKARSPWGVNRGLEMCLSRLRSKSFFLRGRWESWKIEERLPGAGRCA
eukprot:1332445-Amorphochlora_amoeboformis.AAC.1